MFDCATVSIDFLKFTIILSMLYVYIATVYLLLYFNNCDLWDRPKHESTVYYIIVNIKVCILDVTIHFASV